MCKRWSEGGQHSEFHSIDSALQGLLQMMNKSCCCFLFYFLMLSYSILCNFSNVKNISCLYKFFRVLCECVCTQIFLTNVEHYSFSASHSQFFLFLVVVVCGWCPKWVPWRQCKSNSDMKTKKKMMAEREEESEISEDE